MSHVFAVEETIHKPVAHVWAVLTDWNNAPGWMPGIEEMRADGGTAAGTRLTFRARGAERSSEISRCEPDRLITLRSTQGKVTADYTYTLRPVDAHATEVKLTAQCHSSGLVWRLFFPLLRIAIRRVDGAQLANLKRLIET